MLFQILLVIILITIVMIYLKGKYNELYWNRRGVKFHQKNKNLGPNWNFFTENRPFFEHLHDIYKKYPKEPAVGLGSLTSPNLYVIDPVNIQTILSTDFNSFYHRGLDASPKDLLAQNVFASNGKKWKLLRKSMSPMFTSSKLKSMYYIMDKSAQDYVKLLKDNPELRKGNLFSSLSTFCCAAVTATVFGITTNSIFKSPFLDLAQRIFKPSLMLSLRFALTNIFPQILKIVNIKIFSDYEEFFIGAIKQVIRQRETENVKRHDFADICIQLQKQGTLKDPETGYELEPTDELLAAQGFFFFAAGVEPTAAAIHATLLELGRNLDILKNVHKEIDEVFEENDQLSYDIVDNMSLLEMVICEALRMHPPIGTLIRRCVNDTVLPVGNIKVDEGTKIYLPLYELHHDERYYPEPEVFNPERFLSDAKRVSDVKYMPFGGGNRFCIGNRYALLQAKSGLIHLLRDFTVKTTVFDGGLKYKKNPLQIRFDNVNIELIERDLKKES